MSDFVLRYYYFLQDDSQPVDSLIDILRQDSLQMAGSIQQSTLLDPGGFYFNLTDLSGKMNILGIKTKPSEGGWAGALESLRGWEQAAGIDVDTTMGILTIMVDTDGRWPELLRGAATIVKCREAVCAEGGPGRLFRLATSTPDKEAVYIYAPQGAADLPVPLLGRRMPIIHGQLIFLHELDAVWIDRNFSICREKDELEKNLIRILHTKLVMQQPTLAINDELEQDIEVLATAYAKLVADKKLISDGSKRLETNLAAVEKQFLNEPALGMDEDAVAQMMATYRARAEALRQTRENLDLAENEFQAAIEVVQSKIQVINSRTNIDTQMQIKELLKVNIAMQKRSLVFQFAAGLIEFIIVAYYSLNIWSHLAHSAAEIIPSWLQLIFLLLFSGNTVLLTHYLAEYNQGDVHVKSKLIIAGVALALILGIIILGTYLALQQATVLAH